MDISFFFFFGNVYRCCVSNMNCLKKFVSLCSDVVIAGYMFMIIICSIIMNVVLFSILLCGAAKTPFHRNYWKASQFVIIYAHTHTDTHTNCQPGYYLVVDCSDYILCKIGGEKISNSEIGDSLTLSAGVCDVIDARQPVFTLVGQLKTQRGRLGKHNGERS